MEGLPELSGVQMARPDAARLEELGSGGRRDDAATTLDILTTWLGDSVRRWRTSQSSSCGSRPIAAGLAESSRAISIVSRSGRILPITKIRRVVAVLKINDALEWRTSFQDDGPWLFDNLMLAVEGGRLPRKTSTVRKSQDREDQAIHGWREPSHPPDSWRTCRETSPSDRTAGHTGTRWCEPLNAQGDSVRPGNHGCCR